MNHSETKKCYQLKEFRKYRCKQNVTEQTKGIIFFIFSDRKLCLKSEWLHFLQFFSNFNFSHCKTSNLKEDSAATVNSVALCRLQIQKKMK